MLAQISRSNILWQTISQSAHIPNWQVSFIHILMYRLISQTCETWTINVEIIPRLNCRLSSFLSKLQYPPATAWLWLLSILRLLRGSVTPTSSSYYLCLSIALVTLHPSRIEVATTFQPRINSNVSQSNFLSSNIGLQMFQIHTSMDVSTDILLPCKRD